MAWSMTGPASCWKWISSRSGQAVMSASSCSLGLRCVKPLKVDRSEVGDGAQVVAAAPVCGLQKAQAQLPQLPVAPQRRQKCRAARVVAAQALQQLQLFKLLCWQQREGRPLQRQRATQLQASQGAARCGGRRTQRCCVRTARRALSAAPALPRPPAAAPAWCCSSAPAGPGCDQKPSYALLADIHLLPWVSAVFGTGQVGEFGLLGLQPSSEAMHHHIRLRFKILYAITGSSSGCS
jgi:hypothetical protein